MKGVYALIIQVRKNKKVRVGGLGEKNFRKGFYVYVGSGMNNVDKRVARHLSTRKKKHWHVDYLLEEARVVGLKRYYTERDMECFLNKKVGGLSDGVVEGFGCSDCSCDAHLHYFKELGEALNVTDFKIL